MSWHFYNPNFATRRLEYFVYLEVMVLSTMKNSQTSLNEHLLKADLFVAMRRIATIENENKELSAARHSLVKENEFLTAEIQDIVEEIEELRKQNLLLSQENKSIKALNACLTKERDSLVEQTLERSYASFCLSSEELEEKINMARANERMKFENMVREHKRTEETLFTVMRQKEELENEIDRLHKILLKNGVRGKVREQEQVCAKIFGNRVSVLSEETKNKVICENEQICAQLGGNYFGSRLLSTAAKLFVQSKECVPETKDLASADEVNESCLAIKSIDAINQNQVHRGDLSRTLSMVPLCGDYIGIEENTSNRVRYGLYDGSIQTANLYENKISFCGSTEFPGYHSNRRAYNNANGLTNVMITTNKSDVAGSIITRGAMKSSRASDCIRSECEPVFHYEGRMHLKPSGR